MKILYERAIYKINVTYKINKGKKQTINEKRKK